MKLMRLFKHRALDERDAERKLGAGALDRIQARVHQSETRHSGEIRVCVEAGLPLSYLWRDATARERAVTLFGKHRIWDTEQNNGVLIYLLLAEHKIEIVADRGLNKLVTDAQWQQLLAAMAAAFKAGRFEEGLMQAIDQVDQLLARHFPLAEGEVNPNELPDVPIVL